eukprot:3111540-Rhodomonas_salina.3
MHRHLDRVDVHRLARLAQPAPILPGPHQHARRPQVLVHLLAQHLCQPILPATRTPARSAPRISVQAGWRGV